MMAHVAGLEATPLIQDQWLDLTVKMHVTAMYPKKPTSLNYQDKW